MTPQPVGDDVGADTNAQPSANRDDKLVNDAQPGSAGFSLPPQLDTPALVVDQTRLEANLQRMADLASAAGLRLRPHAKTHKCVTLGNRQLAAGAIGLTVATLAEAEMFAAGGCPDLFIAYPLWAGPPRAARLRRLHEQVQLAVGVDSREAAEALAVAVRGSPHPLPVLVEVDCGARRTGVPADAVAALATDCLRLGLAVRGAFTHPGHAYACPEGVRQATRDERDALTAAASALAGLVEGPPVLSGGSTPTALTALASPLTETRPGTYVFGDRQQMALSGLPPERVALVVAARVVSRPRPDELVLDAGSKALSTDRPSWLANHGWLPAAPAAQVSSLTEEHAVVKGVGNQFRVGDLVAVVPNHVCTAVNLARQLTIVDGGAVVDEWRLHTAG